MHELVAEYIDQAIQKRLEARRNYYHTNDAFRTREKAKGLARWHARKKHTPCELCGKSYLYLDRHMLSRKHLEREPDPSKVLINQFEDELKPISDQIEQKTNEIEQIKSKISGGVVPKEYILPIEYKKRPTSVRDLLG